MHHPIDTHSSIILSRHIELLLDYCTRYYERQFITRENKNKALLVKQWNVCFVEYIASGRLQGGKLPTSGYMAGELDLSVAYFDDLLKFETGKTFGGIFATEAAGYSQAHVVAGRSYACCCGTEVRLS